MKNAIIAFICTLLFMAVFSHTHAATFELHGSFLGKSNVEYELYVLNDKGQYDTVEIKRGLFTYKVYLEVGKSYALRFKKGDIVKELLVEVDKSGELELHVDFKSTDSCKLYYDQKKNHYTRTPLRQKDKTRIQQAFDRSEPRVLATAN